MSFDAGIHDNYSITFLPSTLKVLKKIQIPNLIKPSNLQFVMLFRAYHLQQLRLVAELLAKN
jgi:hypothetical protein